MFATWPELLRVRRDEAYPHHVPNGSERKRNWEGPNPADPEAASQALLQGPSLDYRAMMESSKAGMARVLSVITDALERGAVDFFCAAGKDRIGMVTACVLHLCGVGDDDIVAD